MRRLGEHLRGRRGQRLLGGATIAVVLGAAGASYAFLGTSGSSVRARPEAGSRAYAEARASAREDKASGPVSARNAGSGRSKGGKAPHVDARSGPKNLPTSKALPSFTRKGDDVIRLLAGAFDPHSDPLPAPGRMPLLAEDELPAGTAQYWLVQVRDHRFPEVVRAVKAAGGTIAGTIPDGAYMARATPKQRLQIARAPAVRWTGYYQPAWRMPATVRGKKGLLDLAGTRTYRVHLFPKEPNLKAAVRALAAIPGLEIVRDADVVVDVRATAAQLPRIASVPGVQWVGVRPKVVSHNVNARWVNDTGVRDVYAATALGRLTGAGQTAAVADTGVNYTYDLNGRAHIGFRDCNPDGTACKQAIYTQVTAGNSPAAVNTIKNNATGHRKMVAYFDIGDTGPNMFDESSHGTHVAGSVDGDQPGPSGGYDTYTDADGLAPAAEHVHQNIATASGGLVLPADDYLLWRQAYRPRDPASVATSSGPNGNPGDYVAPGYRPLEDARTHNNSYGLLAPVIDEGSAVRLDRFVWDHEDMSIVVSAGNAGPHVATIGSPSVAKNELSSGASANGRQPMASIDSMASFSSHGPTGDLRYGVDLATPGQIVVSAKGGSVDGYHVAQGTSMSGPILTGLATLVRQYFFDGYATAGGDGFAAGSPAAARAHNPSAALVKATLINGAERMRGFYTGDEGGARAQDGQWPSAGQGFGRVSLSNSLYFANDPTNNWYIDVYRGDTTAAGGCPACRSFPLSATPASRSFQIDVAPGEPLDVTLAWTDAPDLAPAGTPALVNNLDLVVTGPGGATYVGNNMNSRADPAVAVAETLNAPGPRDTTNLSERVRVANPSAGTYTITVEAAPIAVGNQGFALAASGRISRVGQTFTPGPPLQRDEAGSPAISNVKVETISADTAKVFFDTNEATTATATVAIAGTPTTFVDSYNVGPGGFPGLDENPGSIETSADYADRPVVGKKHEILITGLTPGQSASVTLTAKDLAATPNQATHATSLNSPQTVFQADADDVGQLYEDEATAAQVGQWRTGTQLYASRTGEGDGSGILGAFMFRPGTAVDPDDITGAVVELTSSHNWVVPYEDDRQVYVDLLASSVEAGWGVQGAPGEDYDEVHNAPADARIYPETTFRRGAYQKYAFTLTCADLQRLKNNLADGGAAFRYESSVDPKLGLFSMEFGFNRRSRGPDQRPKLILFTGQSAYPDGRPCDPATPAPAISDIGIHDGLTTNAVTVTWETDVPSTSMVLFREQTDGTNPWTQVATPALTRIHQVEVLGLDPTKNYEFAVRSAACNGATTTDTNGGAGYDFFRRSGTGDLGPPTTHASYDYETGAEGWTVQTTTSPVPPDTSWVRGAPGANTSANGWHLAIAANPLNKGYSDEDETSLTSPAVTFAGQTAAIKFSIARDTEATFDFVFVEYSANGGATWSSVEQIDGTNLEYPAYEPTPREVRFLNPNPGGQLQFRFRFRSDQLVSSPVNLGASIDQVSFISYPNATDTAPEEDLPLVGPVPPPSAGATGLNPPPTRTGPASAADITAGTGFCDIPSSSPTEPDLVISDMRATNNTGSGGNKKQPREGDKVTVSATVTNSGTGAAPATTTEFLFDGQTVLGLRPTPALAPGESATVEVLLDTRGMKGEHAVQATADKADAADESNEDNNLGRLTFTVQGNKVKNPSFEQQSSEGSGPANWSATDTEAGQTSWSEGGSEGDRSASITGTGGSAVLGGLPAWTSDAIPVNAGETLDLVVSVRTLGASSAPTAGLVYLGALGQVLDTVTLISAPLATGGFQTLEQAATIPSGVAAVRVALTGFAATDAATAGTVTFDNVGLFAR
jgi:Subtilase family/CARDB